MIPDLIYINDKENDKDHFAAISSISRLLFGLRSKLKGAHYCRNCLNEFRSELVLDKHSKICEDNDYCEIIMPSKKKSKLNFDLSKDTSMTLPSIYAELQSILVPITNKYLSINGKESYTIKKMNIYLVVLHYLQYSLQTHQKVTTPTVLVKIV